MDNQSEKTTLVSVIVPAYNVRGYVAECLESLLKQTYQDFEIIVCDDCSTDDTAKILNRFLTDARVRLIKNKKNMRQAGTRNRCIKASRGKYIMLQDADDIAQPDRIEKLIHAFEDGIDFVGSGCYLFNENGMFGKLYGKCQYPSKKDLLVRLPFVHASMMFQRECLVAIGGYRVSKVTDRGEDYDLIMRLYAKGYKGKNINDLLYGYRVDQAAYARRTFKARLDECAIRYGGFKANQILWPIGWLFVFKPLPAHFVQAVKNACRAWQEENRKRQTRVVLSFDDGRADNYEAAMDILFKKKIPAVFNIATAYVDKSIPAASAPCGNPSMSVEDVIQLWKCGFEIAAHGDQHGNSMADIRKGIEKLHLWLNSGHQKGIGFASPHSELKEHDIKAHRDEFRNMGISYIRIGVRNPKEPLRRCIRKAAQITQSVYLYQIGFGNSLERIGRRYVVRSIPVLHKATLEQVKGLVRLAASQGKDCVLMFHSIVKKGSPYYKDTWSWDYDKFVSLCDWLLEMEKKKIKIKIASTMEAFRE